MTQIRRRKDYSDAVEALYSVAYVIKFMSKKELGKDYGVAPLEGLWHASDPSVFRKCPERSVPVDNDDHAADMDYEGHSG